MLIKENLVPDLAAMLNKQSLLFPQNWGKKCFACWAFCWEQIYEQSHANIGWKGATELKNVQEDFMVWLQPQWYVHKKGDNGGFQAQG